MSVGEDPLPHFLGIGAQKAGMTWLAQHLSRHPNVFMPEKKELHYFDRPTRYPSPDILADDHPLARCLGLRRRQRKFRRKFRRRLRKALFRGDRPWLRWACRVHRPKWLSESSSERLHWCKSSSG